MAEQAVMLDAIGRVIVDASLKVHKELGPGLLESVYEHCLAHELMKRRIGVRRQVPLPVVYDGERLDAGLRLDLLVGDAVIIEIKAVESFNPLHQAQLLTYLKLSGFRLGYSSTSMSGLSRMVFGDTLFNLPISLRPLGALGALGG